MKSTSAAGAVEASAYAAVGGSVAQPTPGSHDSTGKNEPSRMPSPECDTRSSTGPARWSRHVMTTVIAAPTGAVRPSGTTIVVAFGRDGDAAGGDPSTVTGPGSRSAANGASRGPLGQSRKTRWSVGRSGLNTTVSSPVTVSSDG